MRQTGRQAGRQTDGLADRGPYGKKHVLLPVCIDGSTDRLRHSVAEAVVETSIEIVGDRP